MGGKQWDWIALILTLMVILALVLFVLVLLEAGWLTSLNGLRKPEL